MSHGGIATQKVFARPEFFLHSAMKSIIKKYAKMHIFLVSLENFPDDLGTFRMIWKLSG